MKLSTNFTLSEMCKSQTAERLGIDNTPTSEHIVNMKLVCENILEPVRENYARPIAPSSGSVSYTHLTLPTTPYV